jgi:ribosomal protein L11 methyltransferase
VSRLADKDWVSASLEDLRPVTAGRFFVCGRHDAARAPANAVMVQLEAGPAFGTGHHESTRGCLLAIERLARRYRAKTPLDLGCGSGVLAIAMAKTWQTRVIASDIDPAAVRAALENGKINGVGHFLRAVTADGFRHRLLAQNAPYDLIVANILAGPLRTLAPAVARHAAANGYVILSGLLAAQEDEVVAAFARQGLYQWRRIALNGWTTMALRH